MNKTETIFEYDLREDVTLRFVMSEFNGKEYYHIREYYQGYPTKKGIKFGLDEFPEFTKGILKLKEYIDNNRNKTTTKTI